MYMCMCVVYLCIARIHVYLVVLTLNCEILKKKSYRKKKTHAQSAGAVEYTDCFSAEG